jgi:hypothetical protein
MSQILLKPAYFGLMVLKGKLRKYGENMVELRRLELPTS